MKLSIQEKTIDTEDITQLYPAAIIRYEDGTVTQISLEWWDDLGQDKAQLLNYAICVHFKDKERQPLQFPYPDRNTLEDGIAKLSSQLQNL